jgi:predicted ATP-grasp superfamily ATP-dependent carboligase
MTLFIYEHLTSGALSGESYSASLMHEGNAMLEALTKDLIALGYNLVVMRDKRLPALSTNDNLSVIVVDSPNSYQQSWHTALEHYQRFLIIAPETGQVLYDLVAEVEQRKKSVLGCNSQTINLCTDKLQFARYLQQRDIVTPDTWSASDWSEKNFPAELEWLIKPIDGAGCESTFRLNTQEAREFLLKLGNQNAQQLIVQPFIDGTNLSLSLFITKSDTALISVNAQNVEIEDNQLHLHRCEPNRFDLLEASEAQNLAETIHDTMPGLWGFIGIDLIKTADKLWVIELNPRLTSSYAEAEMRQQQNPAMVMHRHLTSGTPY